jgi:hypothetical protein
MYTPVMFDFTTEDRYLDRARESVEISFYTKRKCFCVFSFPKKEFLPVRIDSQHSQSGDVLTRAV